MQAEAKKILFISTVAARGYAAVARIVGDGAEIEQESSWESAIEQSQHLFSALKKLAPTAPDVVIVHTGPGSFTGIRIGVSCANALGYAWKKPVIGVSTFEYAATESKDGILLVPGIKELFYSAQVVQGRIQNMFNGTREQIAAHYAVKNPHEMREIREISFFKMINFCVLSKKDQFTQEFNLNTHVVQPLYGAKAHITVKPQGGEKPPKTAS